MARMGFNPLLAVPRSAGRGARAGKSMREHHTPGEATVQCIEGTVEFKAGDTTHLLRAGDLVHLQPRALHALTAVEDASLLVTICLAPG